MDEKRAYLSNLRMTSRFSPRDFAPDGNLDKTAWRHAERARFNHDMSGQRIYAEAQTEVASAWTAAHVYFAFWCTFSILNVFEGEDAAKERWGLWERDVVEVFINPEPGRFNHYYEFEVAPNNQWIDLEIDKEKNPFNDASWDSHFEHATRVQAARHVWTCEMRIPAASLKIREIAPELEWRANLFRADGPGDNSVRRLMAWSPIPGGKSFHAPERFGIIRFVR